MNIDMKRIAEETKRNIERIIEETEKEIVIKGITFNIFFNIFSKKLEIICCEDISTILREDIYNKIMKQIPSTWKNLTSGIIKEKINE